MDNNIGKKLLILGAGQYGTVVKEIAEESGQFEEIAFLDDSYGKDNPNYHEEAVGRIADLEKFTGRYQYAIPAIGDSGLRMRLIEKAGELNFTVPALVSKRAYVSKSACLQKGVVVEPMATVHANALVGKGSYISAGAVVNHNSVVANGCHIDNNAVIMSGAAVAPGTTTKPGETVKAVQSTASYDKSEKWVRDYIKETGHEPTFF